MMNLQQEMGRICSHIQLLTGVRCTLLEAPDGQWPDFPCACGNCQREALRRSDGNAANVLRQYACACGAFCMETAWYSTGGGKAYALLAGPLRVAEHGGCPKTHLPYLKKEAAEAFAETIHSLCKHLTVGTYFVRCEWAGASNEEPPESPCYPVEDERRLQQFIRAGERARANQLLNSLLLAMYHRDGNHLEQMKYRVWELVTLMSRAALDGGADAERILRLCDSKRQQIEQLQTFDALDHCLSGTLHQFFEIAFESGGKKTVIHEVSRYIESHLTEKIALEEVAAHVHFSRSYLCRIIKEETGCTFTEYLNQLRIERSKTYLYRSDLTLAQIASRTGFEDQSYFTRIFKRYVGIPPGRFRMHGRGA